MTARRSPGAILTLLVCLAHPAGSAAATELFPREALERLGVQRYWQMNLPLAEDESVTRTTLLDDNLYVLTNTYKVVAVHSRTGVIRWSTIVADQGLTIRGPAQFVGQDRLIE